MRPRRFELPQVLAIQNGRVTISPGMWRGDDNTRATGTVVSVRQILPGTGTNPANWPVVHGATQVPPGATPRPPTGSEWRPVGGPNGFYETDPFVLPKLGPGVYRLELWRGSATTDRGTPIYEWGIESSNFGPSEAIVEFQIEGQPAPPPPSEHPAITARRRIREITAPWKGELTTRLGAIERIAAMTDAEFGPVRGDLAELLSGRDG